MFSATQPKCSFSFEPNQKDQKLPDSSYIELRWAT